MLALHDYAFGIKKTDEVDTVIVNGRLLMQEKRLLTLDEEQVKTNAVVHASKLLERSGVDISPKWPIV